MKIQTLVSTMNKDSMDFLYKMNIETEVVIGNQIGKQSKEHLEINGWDVIKIDSTDKGLAKNRNLTIDNSNADICILADDDIEYCKGYSNTVKKAFTEYPDADLIVFNLYENPIERYVIKNAHRVWGLEFLRYGSVRIAFKRASVYKKVKFDERFGAGGEIPLGEDTIFLGDCLKAGLKIVAVPDYILKLPPSESSWFNGYTKEYFYNKGKMYYRIFGCVQAFICLQDQ